MEYQKSSAPLSLCPLLLEINVALTLISSSGEPEGIQSV